MAIPVVLVTGFLGCGKTSFLRHLLPLCGEAKRRPALIINEAGDVDVDGELLADLHAEQVKLVGGCVCCTLQAELTGTLLDVLDRGENDLILIECSGLSNPLDVLSALTAPALLSRIAVSHIICLLDGVRAPKVLAVGELARMQVACADVLLLNKADTVPAPGRAPVEELAASLAPNAERVWTTHGDLGREYLLRLLRDPAPMLPAPAPEPHHHHAHALPASFCTVAVRLPESLPRPVLERILHSLPPGVIRAKGFACVAGEGWQVLHKVYESATITPLPGKAPSAGALLVCIGQHLDAVALHAGIGAALPERQDEG